MPIVFQQPGPISEAASSGAGAAQQYSRDLPVLERQQAQLAELLARHYQAGGGGGGAQLPQRPQQGALFTGGAQGQNMQAPTQAPQQRDDPLVQSEVIRLQQLKNGMAYVDQQQQGGSLTQEEADNLRTQLQTGINPLQQRVQRSQAKALEEQTQQTMHQNAQMTQMMSMDSTQLAQQAQRFTSTVRDDEGNVIGTTHFDPFTRRSTFHPKEKEQREPVDRAAATQKQMADLLHRARAHVAAEHQRQSAATFTGTRNERLDTPEGREEAAQELARGAASFSGMDLPAAPARPPQPTPGAWGGSFGMSAINSAFGAGRGGQAADGGGFSAANLAQDQSGMQGESVQTPPTVQAARTAIDQAINQASRNTLNDPGRVSEAGAAARSSPDEFVDARPGGVPTWMRQWNNALPLQDFLHAQPRVERPNEHTRVGGRRVEEAANAAAHLYNHLGQGARRASFRGQHLGVLADLLRNAHEIGRPLRRHELAAYRATLRRLRHTADNEGFTEAELAPLQLEE